MPMSDGGTQRSIREVPPWPGEDHGCPECRLAYSDVSVARGVEIIRSVPDAARVAVAGIPPEIRGRRPAGGGWSAAEYVCHLRDVYITFTIRLHRARTEDDPVLEPMLNDLRARRFRYHERDTGPVLDELAATAAGFCDEVATLRSRDWGRTVQRLPGEQRTALWLLRQAAHEGRHHVGDLQTMGTGFSAWPARS